MSVLSAGLKICRDRDGSVGVEERPEETKWQAWGSFKAEKVLYFSARSFALAGLGELEAFMEFYECLLEEFHSTPQEGFSGPSVEDLRTTEMGVLRQALRMMHSTKCPFEDALHTTVPWLVINIY